LLNHRYRSINISKPRQVGVFPYTSTFIFLKRTISTNAFVTATNVNDIV